MANFDNYTNYADNAGVSGVIFGANSAVLEVELNEMQEIQTHYLREFIKSITGDGITDISKLTYSDGKIKIADGCNIICNGYLIKADKLELSITNGIAYLWMWEEEVDYGDILYVEGNVNHSNSVKNWIKDDRANNETTKRKVIKYKLTNTVPTHPEYSYLPIAKIIGNQMIKLINEINANFDYADDDIYGVEVDWENNTSMRLAGSVGKTGGTDHNNIMAFNRRKCIVAPDGQVLAYYGDTDYTETGKTTKTIVRNNKTYPGNTLAQVMVEQNKFYYKVIPLKLEKISDSTGYKIRKARYYISCTPKDGFKVHPAFIRNGVEVDKIYIASYKASIYSDAHDMFIHGEDVEYDIDMTADTLMSIADIKPASGMVDDFTRSTMRELASNILLRASYIGINVNEDDHSWQLKDFTITSMDILLFLIEYATLNIQNVIGLGHTLSAGTEIANLAHTTGLTSTLGNGTGIIDGERGLSSIIYRGEENIFGDLWEIIDGFNINIDHHCYWANHGFTDDIDVSPYESCGFATARTNGYITAFGYSEKCDFSFIPVETLDNGDEANNSIGDYAWISYYDSWKTPAYGGSWDGGFNCGICTINTFPRSGVDNNNVGCRIAYIPLNN